MSRKYTTDIHTFHPTAMGLSLLLKGIDYYSDTLKIIWMAKIKIKFKAKPNKRH
jgi:hypothetical protein